MASRVAGDVGRPDRDQTRAARLIRISERGAALGQERGRVTELEVEAEWTRHLGADAMEHLRKTMIKLREITDPYAE